MAATLLTNLRIWDGEGLSPADARQAQTAGLTPTQALRSATSVAADVLGIGKTTGRLQPGLAADLILAHGDPLADLSALAEPAAVWARGIDVQLPE